MVEVAVLGGFRVVIGGIDVTPRAPKERALLALLAVEPGRVVAADRLLEDLWPDLPPDRGRHVLQVRIAAIRRRLADAGAPDALSSVPPGYRLDIGLEAFDSACFEALVEQGRALLSAGEPRPAAETLRSALRLWRGEAFADAQGCQAVEAEAGRLEELRLGAVEARIAAELADGCHQRLIPELDALVAAHPLREGLWEQRVLALYRCGRQAEALRACAAIRDRLRDELGVEPGAGLRNLESAVLAQSPSLDWRPATAPTAGQGVTVHQGNLPTAEPLVGRDLEVARVAEMVKVHRLVTVTGPPGVGKSRLALAVAHEIAGDVADGAWLVELAPLGDPSSLVAAVAGVVPLPSMPTTAAELVDRIGSRQLLLVLDNCEHVVEAVAVLAAQLVAACPRIRVLCTSQETLAVEGEHVWPLAALEEDAAIDLFEERARAARPDVATDPETVAVIVRRLDCLPLAIELAAARTSTLGPAEIAGQLDDRFHLLSGVLRGRPPRHRALAAMVDWSHDLLHPRQQRMFRRLGIYSGSFARDAATEIADVESAGPATLVGDLDHLVRRSLVVADVGTGTTRYRLLETLRHYALDRLAEAGETETLGRRHAEWYTEMAEEFEAVASPDEALWLARGLAEFDNLRAAVEFAVGHGDTDLAVTLVARLSELSLLWRPELFEWARQVLALPGAGDHPQIGYIHLILAGLGGITGDLDTSEQAADEALRHQLDEGAWTLACIHKASMLGYRERHDERAALLAAALDRVAHPVLRTALRLFILVSESRTGVPTGLDPERLIASADASGVPNMRAFARNMVAIVLVTRGQSADATRLLHESLEIVSPGLNRNAVNIANEFLLLAGSGGPGLAAPGLAGLAARTVALGREYPFGLGYALIGLAIESHAHRGGAADAAIFAGYLAGHLDDLALTATSVEVLARGPLDRFVTPATEADFRRGQTMTIDDLHAELRRLAGPVRPHDEAGDPELVAES